MEWYSRGEKQKGKGTAASGAATIIFTSFYSTLSKKVACLHCNEAQIFNTRVCNAVQGTCGDLSTGSPARSRRVVPSIVMKSGVGRPGCSSAMVAESLIALSGFHLMAVLPFLKWHYHNWQ